MKTRRTNRNKRAIGPIMCARMQRLYQEDFDAQLAWLMNAATTPASMLGVTPVLAANEANLNG